MRILVVGPFASQQRESSISEGFRRNGHDVSECQYADLLFSQNLVSRVQFKLSIGPIFNVLKNRVIDAAKSFKPDTILFRRPLEFSSNMIKEIRATYPAIYVSFNNDDPFSETYNDTKWKSLRNAIPDFDLHFAFRKRNIKQYKLAGAKNVALWEPFYTPWLHYPIDSNHEFKKFHLLFAMHAERDERREILMYLLASNIPVKIHSWNWASVFGKKEAKKINVKPPIWDKDYIKAINQSTATLCFFSKQNNDELTSRVFEIPACRGLLLSWRTARLEALFKDREEALFFSSKEELLKIVKQLENEPNFVENIKQGGYEKLRNSRYSIVDRCYDAIKVIERLG